MRVIRYVWNMSAGIFASAVLCAALFLFLSCSDDDRKVIVCWGDSLTSPGYKNNFKGHVKHFFQGNKKYPEFFQDLLGDDFEVVNAGVGGENTLTIMARQGAYPMRLAHDVVVFRSGKKAYKTFVGNNDVPAFVSSYNGKKVDPLLQNGWDDASSAQISPCRIGDEEYELSSESTFWKETESFLHEYNYYIERVEAIDRNDTLKAGTEVVTYAMQHLRNCYANIFFMGQNGGFSDVADLIRQLKAMIRYSGSDRFVVVSFHKPNKVIKTISRMKEMEDSLHAAFGEHYLNLRDSMLTNGLEYADLKPSDEDTDSIKVGQVPPQLLLPDGIHFKTEAYEVIANLIYRRFTALY